VADLQEFRLPDKAPDPPAERKGAPVDAGLPSNLHAEQTLVGACLLDPVYYNEIAERLTPADFSSDSYCRIFRCIGELIDAGSAIDIVTVSAELRRTKELDTVGGISALAGLTEGLPRRPVVGDYIKLVLEKSQLRRMIQLFNVALLRAQDQSETPLSILEEAEGQLLEIAQDAQAGALRTIYQSVEAAGGLDPYLKAYTEPQFKTGLQTGFIDYDRLTGGLQKQELTVWAGRPSMGKTAIAMNLIENVCCGTDKVAAFFSLEMSRSSIERRFMASRARVDVKRAMDGWFLSGEEKRKLGVALNDLLESHIFIDDSPTLTPVQMRAKARRLKQREGRLDLAVCDYLQLMAAGVKTGNRQEEIAHVSRSLKAMAKELDCCVVALAQLNRQPEQRQDKRPVLSDLRESGQIEQDGDVICFVHRPEYYDRDNQDLKGLAEIIIAKQRNGPTDVVKLAFEGSLTRFDNLARG
jgi:replicative DNA helicase